MRAAPAVHVSVTRFGAWRAAVGVVLALVWAVVGAWVLAHGQAIGGAPPPWVAGVATAALASASWLAAGLAASPACGLRWDGRSWFVSPIARSGVPSGVVDAVPGDVAVMIDLGPWLLLRFAPERPQSASTVPQWLPVQRRGLEASWHALRCAVHSPRPPLD